jgi:DNA-binding NarL/FixJ family response regulator
VTHRVPRVVAVRCEGGIRVKRQAGVIRVLLADDQALFREAVRGVLEGQSDLEVVADVRDGLNAVAEAGRTRPSVAVLGTRLSRCDGLSTAELIKERVPTVAILLVADDEDHDMLARAFDVGISGYLTKDCALVDLIDTVRALDRGETVVPPTILGGLIEHLIGRRRHQDAILAKFASLTRREREVLSLLADGADNDAIALALVISPQTARTHIQNVIGKLGVHSRLEAAMLMRQSGIHEPAFAPWAAVGAVQQRQADARVRSG